MFLLCVAYDVIVWLFVILSNVLVSFLCCSWIVLMFSFNLVYGFILGCSYACVMCFSLCVCKCLVCILMCLSWVPYDILVLFLCIYCCLSLMCLLCFSCVCPYDFVQCSRVVLMWFSRVLSCVVLMCFVYVCLMCFCCCSYERVFSRACLMLFLCCYYVCLACV